MLTNFLIWINERGALKYERNLRMCSNEEEATKTVSGGRTRLLLAINRKMTYYLIKKKTIHFFLVRTPSSLCLV